MGHVVLGAGPLGVSLRAALATAGTDATLFAVMDDPAYDMPGTTPDRLDGTDTAALRRACTGAEVIYLCLNAHYVDWYERFPPRLDAAIAAAAAVGATLVYHDTVYVYGASDEPLTEHTRPAATTRKGRLRAAMADSFLTAAGDDRIRGVIGRTADMYGPGALNSSFNSTLGERHFEPLLAGRAVSVLGDADQPHTYAYVGDVARGLIELGAHDDALGEVWHLPAAPTLSHRELLTLASEIAGLPPKIRASRVSGLVVRVAGRFQRDLGEVAELLDVFDGPLVVSHEKFARRFGADPTPHRDALGATLEWYADPARRRTGRTEHDR